MAATWLRRPGSPAFRAAFGSTSTRSGVAAYVESVDANAVSIFEQSNAEFKRFVYDRRSGWLLHHGLEQSSSLGSFTQTFDLTGVQ